MEQKLSDTLVKAIDRSNPMMQNLQLASRFNKLIDESGGDLEDNHEIEITENGEIEIIPAEGKDGMKKVTATVNVSSGGGEPLYCWCVYSKAFPQGAYIYTNYDKTPDASAFLLSKRINNIGEQVRIQQEYDAETLFEKTSDTEFTTTNHGSSSDFSYERDTNGDFTSWS